MKRFSLVTEILGGPQAETVKVRSATHMSRQNTDFMVFTSADVKLCEASVKYKAPGFYGREPYIHYLLLRPPPRLPSMLRFRSAIFPSDEERNCLSLSSKARSPEEVVSAA